nr:RagB/SusD family nutrient uptake outer membrane protein [uncultured Bacteroides sp.]
MKKRYFWAAVVGCLLSLGGCSGFLDQTPDRILNNDQVYGDPNLVKSVLANLYERITWGQRLDSPSDYSLLDDAIQYSREGRQDEDRNWWRVYDYELVRNINQFLKGLKESTALSDAEKAPLEGEARLIRAWYYFCMCRSLGGMPNVGDNVYSYTSGMDITTLQNPRESEAATYDYVISECHAIADIMNKDITIHSARANKWAAKMLEARAALYAASLAKYNNEMSQPLKTAGGEVGIDASKANGYYEEALAAAADVIDHSPYSLMKAGNKATWQDYADNFYNAICEKNGNTEVIWARDYVYPGQTHGFTKSCLPRNMNQDVESSLLSVLLNLVEAYEPIETSTPGMPAKFETGTLQSPVFFNKATDPFTGRDPRLGGTVLYPGSFFNGQEAVLQGGLLEKGSNGGWNILTAKRGDQDAEGNIITADSGPYEPADDRQCNRTGFYIRKFLDATPSAGTIGRGSEMWNPYFRISEAYMIAAEASFELKGSNDEALGYINEVRERAGVKPLVTLTFENIVHENQVEFAFEDHRWWDLKRWRLADKIWNGDSNNPSAQRRGLWPYRVLAPGDSNDGKWVFFEKNMTEIYPYPLKFEARQYYAELDGGWLNNNPKLVKNPYQ